MSRRFLPIWLLGLVGGRRISGCGKALCHVYLALSHVYLWMGEGPSIGRVVGINVICAFLYTDKPSTGEVVGTSVIGECGNIIHAYASASRLTMASAHICSWQTLAL